MRKASSKRLTPRQKAELKALARLPDAKINRQDVPEVKDWSGAKRSLFYRPIKRQLTLRIDADVVDWFQTHAPRGRGYQTDINRALRQHVRRQMRRSKAV
jgi:uncharacterized protein (DUF4415 family)